MVSTCWLCIYRVCFLARKLYMFEFPDCNVVIHDICTLLKFVSRSLKCREMGDQVVGHKKGR